MVISNEQIILAHGLQHWLMMKLLSIICFDNFTLIVYLLLLFLITIRVFDKKATIHWTKGSIRNTISI